MHKFYCSVLRQNNELWIFWGKKMDRPWPPHSLQFQRLCDCRPLVCCCFIVVALKLMFNSLLTFVVCWAGLMLKTATPSWLQNDGARGVLWRPGKQLLPMFWPDALVIFKAKFLKATRVSGLEHLVATLAKVVFLWAGLERTPWFNVVLCSFLLYFVPLRWCLLGWNVILG